MDLKVKKVIIRGKEMVFEVPEKELYCEKCETTNYIYENIDMPHECDNCGELLKENDPDAE